MSFPKYLAAFVATLAVVWVLVVASPRARTDVGASSEKHGGEIVFEVKKNKQKLLHSLFSHKDHLDAGHSCKDCHNNKIFKRDRELGVNKFTMKDIMKGEACGACHNGKMKVKGKTVFHPKKNCTRCHNTKFRKDR